MKTGLYRGLYWDCIDLGSLHQQIRTAQLSKMSVVGSRLETCHMLGNRPGQDGAGSQGLTELFAGGDEICFLGLKQGPRVFYFGYCSTCYRARLCPPLGYSTLYQGCGRVWAPAGQTVWYMLMAQRVSIN